MAARPQDNFNASKTNTAIIVDEHNQPAGFLLLFLSSFD